MGSECQTMDMNWIGATLLLLFVFQDIVFAKHFLVETGDEEAAPSEEIVRWTFPYWDIWWTSHARGKRKRGKVERRREGRIHVIVDWDRRRTPQIVSVIFEISGKFESLAK